MSEFSVTDFFRQAERNLPLVFLRWSLSHRRRGAMNYRLLSRRVEILDPVWIKETLYVLKVDSWLFTLQARTLSSIVCRSEKSYDAERCLMEVRTLTERLPVVKSASGASNRPSHSYTRYSPATELSEHYTRFSLLAYPFLVSSSTRFSFIVGGGASL